MTRTWPLILVSIKVLITLSVGLLWIDVFFGGLEFFDVDYILFYLALFEVSDPSAHHAEHGDKYAEPSASKCGSDEEGELKAMHTCDIID